MGPGPADALDFTTEPPSWVAKNTTFNAAVTVTDAWGNTVPGHPVSIVLGNNPGGATLTCPLTAIPCVSTSDLSGVASFALRMNADSVGYTLAASGSPNASSRAFSVADALANCPPSCSPGGRDDAGTTVASTTVNGQISGNQVGVAVDNTVPIRFDLCGGPTTQVGSGMVFEAVNTGTSDQPSWSITMTVLKAGLVDTSRGAASYDVCLGTRNLSVADGNPPATTGCAPNSSATSFSTSLSWPAKGGCAVPDDPAHLDTSVYWGNMLNAGAAGTNTSASIKNCSGARAPVVLSKNKSGPGNLVITFCVPWPWDGFGGSH